MYSFRNSDFTIPFEFGFDNSSRISEGCKAFSIQMVETILHVGLDELSLKEIKKIYGVVTKSAKQSPTFAPRASFVLVLGCVLLVLCRIVLVLSLVVSCCTRVVSCYLVLYSCCVMLSLVVLVLSRFVLVLCRVVLCCYTCSFLDQIFSMSVTAALILILNLNREEVVQRCFLKKDALKNFATFTGNTCARVFSLIRLQAAPATLSKKRHWQWHRCFPAKFAKFLRTPFFLQKTCGGSVIP